MGSYRKATAVALALALGALGATALVGGSAEAFDKHGFLCGDRTDVEVNWTGSEWNVNRTWKNGGQATMKSLGEVALSNWRQATDDHGNALFDNSSSAQEYSYDWKSNYPFNGAWAVTTCPTEDVNFNLGQLMDIVDFFNPSGFVGFVAHETGHVYGLGHSGREDSYQTITGHWPIMSTCLGSDANNRDVVIQDGHAAASYLNSSTDWKAVTANRSFEDTLNNNGSNIEWWTPLSAWYPVNSGVHGTPTKARLSGSTMYNRTRVTDTHGNFAGDVYKDDIKASTWVRDVYSSQWGPIEIRTVYRIIEYPDGDDLGCNFVGDLRNNEPVWVSPWVWGPIKTCYLSTTWSSCSTVVDEFLTWPPGESDAADVQVQIWNNTYNPSTGARRPVDLDLSWLLYNFDL